MSNIPVVILTFEFDWLNVLLCYSAGCMRWTSRFRSQKFLSSCLDHLVRLFFGLHVFLILCALWCGILRLDRRNIACARQLNHAAHTQ